MIGDSRSRWRNVSRSFARTALSPANCTASRTYSSGVDAIHSVSPTVESMLAALRDTDRDPGAVTTGTPIHSASQVVVPPLYGAVSKAISTALNQRKYSCTATRGTTVILVPAIPALSKY